MTDDACRPYPAGPAMTTIERLRALHEQATASISRADKAVDDLCHGRLRWEMRVPAEPDHDPDLIIAAALRDGVDLVNALPALLGVADALRVLVQRPHIDIGPGTKAAYDAAGLALAQLDGAS